MPIVLLLGLILGILVVGLLLTPISLVVHYRTGTAKRRARSWLVTLNVVGFAISMATFLVGAAVATRWLPQALTFALAGLGAGCVLGAVGLALSQWEISRGSVHYTPNRWLVLGITLVVTSRVLYGIWRSWHAWRAAAGDSSWLEHSGAEGSFAAGALVLGYYLTYWIGVRQLLLHHSRRAGR